MFAVAADDGKWRVPAGLAAGYLGGSGLFRGGVLPEPGWVGGVVAVTVGLLLIRPRWSAVSGLCAGLLAGILSGLMQYDGLPLPAALVLALVLPGLSLGLARRHREFAPAQIREEALLLMLVLGLGAAVVPAVVEGWRSAGALNAAVAEGVNRAIPVWALTLAGISVLLGGMWSLWRHR